MNKFDRVISTLVLLQTKKVIKASTISERFDISLRTVYRDINTLKTAGIPIIGDPGIGYSILEGYRMAPIMFNEGEATAMLTAEKFIGQMTDKATLAYYTSAMTKIKAILRNSEKQSLEILEESIAIEDFGSTEDKTYLQDLFKSIAAKHVIKIDYRKADGTASERKVEPIGCYHHANNWYLVGHCHLKKAYRTFKVNRIVHLYILEEHFEKRHISLNKYIEDQRKAWKEQELLHTVRIMFSHSYVQFAERRKYYFGFLEQEEKNDGVYMTFLNPSLELIARWLMQFADQATVISPPELKERMETLSAHLYRHYHKEVLV